MAFLSCDEFRALLADEVAGLEVPERETRSHLAACASCQAHAGEILWQDRVLAELSARARADRLMAAVREAILSTKPVAFGEPAPRARPTRPRWGAAAAAAALLLAALGALLFWRPSERGEVVVHPPAQIAPSRGGAAAHPSSPEERQVSAPEPSISTAKAADREPPPTPGGAEVAKRPERPRAEADPNAPTASGSSPVPPRAPLSARTPAEVEAKPAKDIELARTRTVDEAVREGMAYLRGRSAAIEGARLHHELRYDELVLWTWLHGGMAQADPEFQKVLGRMLDRRLERTYAVALQAMVLEELDRVAWQGRIQQCAQFLLDNQCRNGQWGYGDPSIFAEEVPSGGKRPAPAKELGPDGKPRVVRRVVVKKMRPGRESGDHSNSMYAALGLRACHDAGIVLPKDAVLLAQKAWREAQIRPEGGWCYGKHEGHRAYGSMTAGGVGSLVIYDYIAGEDRKRDREVQAGLEWLENKFSVAYNPGPVEHASRGENGMQHYFYYLYALERAAILYGTATIGRHDWYQKGSEALLGCQRPDGSWLSKEGGNEVSDTCFAVLFLRRATRALPDVPTGQRR